MVTGPGALAVRVLGSVSAGCARCLRRCAFTGVIDQALSLAHWHLSIAAVILVGWSTFTIAASFHAACFRQAG
jgi:hypothetical protein